MPGILLTIGHSTRELDEFLQLLRAHLIAHVADVRRIPRSRRHPQYSREALAAALARGSLGYSHHPELGGFRQARPDSPHSALTDPRMCGYAEHMESAEFAGALGALLELAASRTTAVMCAEADPERCHRRLLADAVTVRGIRVEHVLDAGPRRPHVLNPAAERLDGRLIYRGNVPRLPGL